jgi:hypothetical protein
MNDKYNSRDKFFEFSKDAHYLRVDPNHPLELLIGKDEKGQKTLRLVEDFKVQNIKNTQSISITHFKYGETFALNISLTNEDYSDLFYLMCDDLIDSSRICNDKKGYNFIINRFEKWKQFTNTINEYLSESEVKGLLGELLSLDKHFISKYGASKAINGWTGTEPTIKDFTYDDFWYEIKSTTNNEIIINSIEQLDSDIIGLLIVIKLEKMSPESSGLSLNSIYENITKKLESSIDRSAFLIKEYYEKYKYRIVSFDYYKVNHNFPKIKKDSLDSAITKVKYTLTLNLLENYQGEFE